MNNEAELKSDFLLYESSNGTVHIDVLLDGETVWLSQKKIAELFNVERSVITKHISNVFSSEELNEDSNVQKMHIADSAKPVKFYNLNVIVSVGYRVNSKEATQFRIWATEALSSYIIKGFVIDDERLKNGSRFGQDYFDELLERIREIRASERRFYQKITDIYATAADYRSDSKITKNFYATVQNKLHFAIHGRTAAELIVDKADSNKPNMGLTNWKNSPDGKVLKSDVSIGKNYLAAEQLTELNRVVNMYLDYAENQASRRLIMKMSDWVNRLDAFLEFNEYEILNNLGNITATTARKLAEDEYDKYRVSQDKEFESDFDREVKRLELDSEM